MKKSLLGLICLVVVGCGMPPQDEPVQPIKQALLPAGLQACNGHIWPSQHELMVWTRAYFAGNCYYVNVNTYQSNHYWPMPTLGDLDVEGSRIVSACFAGSSFVDFFNQPDYYYTGTYPNNVVTIMNSMGWPEYVGCLGDLPGVHNVIPSSIMAYSP